MIDPAQAHVPVLREETIQLLAPALESHGSVPRRGSTDPALLLDATLGMGGHSEALLERFENLHVIGLDRDPQALELSRGRLARFGDRVRLVHAVYDDIPSVLDELGLSATALDGVLFDLGVSSLQLDEDDRGFSYARDTALDMRMDATTGQTAADVLNTYSHADLTRVLREYGEERFAHKIAGRIVAERDREPFTTSARLVDLVREAVPAATRRTGGNPSKRTFQALRIEVNSELSVLRRALPEAVDALVVGGRIVVMSYHSLEDRIAKTVLTQASTSSAPPDLPVVPTELQPVLRLVTRGAMTASSAEIERNPRAASVKLRAAEKVQNRPLPRPERTASQRTRSRSSNRTKNKRKAAA